MRYDTLSHSDHVLFIVVPMSQPISIVDCSAFRRLLLILRRDIDDSDIPHRSKMRELVLRAAWKSSFDTIRAELKVNGRLVSNKPTHTFLRNPLVKSHSPAICGLRIVVTRISP